MLPCSLYVKTLMHISKNGILLCICWSACYIVLCVSSCRKYDPKPSLHHKNIKYHEPFLYPDPLGDTRPELSRFYQRVAKISQLEDDTIKYEDSRRKTHSKPATYTTNTMTTHLSRCASARILSKAPSVKSVARRCGTISLNDQPEDHLQSPTHNIMSHSPNVSSIGSPTHNDVIPTNDTISSHTQNYFTPTDDIISSPTQNVTQTDDVISSPNQNDITPTDDVIRSSTHNSTTDLEASKPDIELLTTDMTSPSHSNNKHSNLETMICGPVLLCNGHLTTQDYEHARRHLSKSHDQLASCHKTTYVTSHTKTRKKSLKNRPSSATHLLTESSSSTSVSSVCSDKSHVKQNRHSSNKKRHKK